MLLAKEDKSHSSKRMGGARQPPPFQLIYNSTLRFYYITI